LKREGEYGLGERVGGLILQKGPRRKDRGVGPAGFF